MSEAPLHSGRENPFNAKLVIGLIAAGLIAFAALVLLLAFGSRIGPIHDARAPALSVSATGYKGLVSLIGHFHETRQIGGTEDLSTDDLVVVALEANNRAEDVQRLIDLRRGRATLIILPKWVTMPDPSHRGWVRALGTGAGQESVALIGGKAQVRVSSDGATAGRVASGRDILEGIQVPVPGNVQTISGDTLIPLVATANGDALV